MTTIDHRGCICGCGPLVLEARAAKANMGFAVAVMVLLIEFIQRPRLDRNPWFPGADSLRRRVAADRVRPGWPGSGRPQCAGAGHGAAQRRRRHPGDQPEFFRHHDAAIRAGGFHRPAADLDPDSKAAGRTHRVYGAGGIAD